MGRLRYKLEENQPNTIDEAVYFVPKRTQEGKKIETKVTYRPEDKSQYSIVEE